MASMTSGPPIYSGFNKLERVTVLREALVAAQAISDDGRRAFALAVLAPHLPDTLLPKLAMEFATEGGKGPTPHEALLHAAVCGDSTRFNRQGRRRGPLQAADPLVAGHGRWHGPWVTA
jgi:hypothetical protein